MHVESMTDQDWDVLDNVDAMIFGSPTYMGNVSAGFPGLRREDRPAMHGGRERDKVAAGFTNSGARAATSSTR